MNADEAAKCLNIAKRAINERNFEKAEKFLTKSIKLHDNNEAQALLQRLDAIRASSTANSAKSSSRAPSPPVVKRTPTPEPVKRPYTAEQ